MNKKLETLREAIFGVLLADEWEDFAVYLNETRSEQVDKAFPFNASLDEALLAITDWLDEIEDDPAFQKVA